MERAGGDPTEYVREYTTVCGGAFNVPEASCELVAADTFSIRAIRGDAIVRIPRVERLSSRVIEQPPVAVYEPRYNERGLLNSENLFVRAQRLTVDGVHSHTGGDRTSAISSTSSTSSTR